MYRNIRHSEVSTIIINNIFILVRNSSEAGQLIVSLLELRLLVVQVVSDVLQLLQAGQDRR